MGKQERTWLLEIKITSATDKAITKSRGDVRMKDAKGSNWSIDGDEFAVLVNHEDQYSIWPSAQPAPEGWTRVGPVGTKAVCLGFIDKVWTDMRPRSLREAMDHETAAPTSGTFDGCASGQDPKPGCADLGEAGGAASRH
jgi:MbtH protein